MKRRVQIELDVRVSRFFRVQEIPWWKGIKVSAVRTWYAFDGLRVWQCVEWRRTDGKGPVYPDGWSYSFRDTIPPHAIDPEPDDPMPPWRPAQFRSGIEV